MAVLPFTLDELESRHLEGLIDAEASESNVLEFKSEPYAPDHDGTREFLKDVTAFTNTSGGFLFIGIRESAGTASDIVPIPISEADKVKQRLESLLQTAVEPRIFGVAIRCIPVNGGCVIGIRIPRSLAPPHRVTAKNSNRFYLRSSAGAYEASMEELRSLFVETAAMRDRVLSFQRERLLEIAALRTPVPTVEGDDMLVLHVVPASAFGAGAAVDLAKARRETGAFRPMRASGWNACFNFLGLLSSRPGQACHGYTQLFREGIVEAVYKGIVGANAQKQLSLYAPHVADMILGYSRLYVEGLAKVGASPPYFVLPTLLGTDGATVVLSDRTWLRGDQQAVVGDFPLPICLIEDVGTEEAYEAALKPALDALWNAGDVAEWTRGK